MKIELQLSDVELVMYALELLKEIRLLEKETQTRINKIQSDLMKSLSEKQ